MRTAYIISAVGHAAVLLWSVWSFAAKPLVVPPGAALPVDIVSVSEFTQMTAGNKSAPKAETPKPLVEKVAEAKPVEAKPETKPAEAKPDPIAEALKKEQAKKPEPKKAEAKPPTPPKKPAPPAPKFDPHQVEALLNKQAATRVAAAGDILNSTPALGPPSGAKNPQEIVVQVRMLLKPDGTLAAPPMATNSGSSQLFMAARDSAMRAVLRGQPYDMLRPEHYEQWKDIEVTF